VITPVIDFRPGLLPVRHQGRRQSCLAFASSTAHEHQKLSAEHLCVEYLYFHAVARTAGQNPLDGTTMAAAAAALADEGQPVESAWPYAWYQPSPWTPPPIKLLLHKTTMTPCKLDFAGIVTALDMGIPVVLGLVITDAFYQPDGIGRIPVRTPDIERGGHAVLAVGHGVDSIGPPSLLIRNSWGPGWGQGGYAWLPRAYVDRQLHETALFT
jgi:Cysteine protease